MQSLQQKGFYTIAAKDAAGQTVPKVVSNKGEVLVGMESGVEYVLRFGEIYRGPEDEENSSGESRYIYAFARVNESLFLHQTLNHYQLTKEPKVLKVKKAHWQNPVHLPTSLPLLPRPVSLLHLLPQQLLLPKK